MDIFCPLLPSSETRGTCRDLRLKWKSRHTDMLNSLNLPAPQWNNWISVFCELGRGFYLSSLCSCSFPWPLLFSSPGFCSSLPLLCPSFHLLGSCSSQLLRCDAGPCSRICLLWFWSCWLSSRPSPHPCCSASVSRRLPPVWSHPPGCDVDSSLSLSVCNLLTPLRVSWVTCSCERRPCDSWLAAQSWSCYPDRSLCPSSFSFGSWPCCGFLNPSHSQGCCCCWSQSNCRCFHAFSCVFLCFFSSVFCSSFSLLSAFLSGPVFWNNKVSIKTPGLE